jgi:CRISPR system Cascade subunit CasC
MKSCFAQIHFLTSYPSVLLNRDDAGFAKRIPFGGVSRTRISSQCLKRHWRTFKGKYGLGDIENAEMSVRSRLTFNEYLLKPLIEEGIDRELAYAVVQAIVSEVLGESVKAKKAKADSEPTDDIIRTNQVTVMGHAEMRFLQEQARIICSAIASSKDAATAVKKHFSKDASKNLKGLKRAAGLDAALFGRMVTSDILSRGDAAVHVAHAFTVHSESSESDYFSAVDDLMVSEGELGSGHINSVELNSGLFYGYVVVDVPLLIGNIEGCPGSEWQNADRTMAAEVMKRLIPIIATVSPGAKLGSTAPHSYAQMMLVEFGDDQPRTLANAFLKPVSETPDLLGNAYRAIGNHIAEMARVYGNSTEFRFMGVGPVDHLNLGESETLDSLSSWASDRVLDVF